MSLAHVSRETAARLDHLKALVTKWNSTINLVSRSSLPDLDRRHIADSAQFLDHAPHPVAHWADLGSGGGFPGLIVAIHARATGSPARVTLVESDRRKCAFLATAIRELDLAAEVRCARIESVPPLAADVVSARALADLRTLLGFAARHMAPGGIALLAKGANWQNELTVAQSAWQFAVDVARSNLEPGSVILCVKEIARA